MNVWLLLAGCGQTLGLLDWRLGWVCLGGPHHHDGGGGGGRERSRSVRSLIPKRRDGDGGGGVPVRGWVDDWRGSTHALDDQPSLRSHCPVSDRERSRPVKVVPEPKLRRAARTCLGPRHRADPLATRIVNGPLMQRKLLHTALFLNCGRRWEERGLTGSNNCTDCRPGRSAGGFHGAPSGPVCRRRGESNHAPAGCKRWQRWLKSLEDAASPVRNARACLAACFQMKNARGCSCPRH